MFLGLDLGTSGLKALLIGDDDQVLGETTASLDVSRPHEGWSEQDPDRWIAAAEAALGELARSQDLSAVRAIGLSGQMHGATLLGDDDAPLRPCMLWNDVRSAREAAAMDAEPAWQEISGNIVFPGFTAPKVEWVRVHEPKVFRRIRKVLLPKDYLRLWLTGEHVSDMSDAAGTSWLDVGRRQWSGDLLARSELSPDHMPGLVEGAESSGEVRPEIARRFGFAGGTIVAGGGGDNAASAIGAGVVAEGEAFLSLGTSGVLFVANDGYRPDPKSAVHTFCHALPGRWHQMGVILNATAALNWYAAMVGHDATRLTGGLGELRAPSALFLPYLGGERTPINDAAARAAFVGLGYAVDAEAGARAVMEGVAFAFRDCRDALAATGTRIERALSLGGGSRSDYWLKVLATVLDIPLDVPAGGEFGAAKGAARLGRMALTGEPAAAPPPVARTVEPNRDLKDAFDQAHARWKATYLALREIR